ncbi:MAG: hypothetical protein FWF23_03135 [Alphaproteobacteria bacterium]|nr:hypothetical protein [Alphaproteobacteria bacterium]MCL2505584.1 hypothetical protein [Alphaproteobacteria bacterium]
MLDNIGRPSKNEMNARSKSVGIPRVFQELATKQALIFAKSVACIPVLSNMSML